MDAIQHPLSEIGYQALESFLDLPCVERWDPVNLFLRELSDVFDAGLPTTFLRGNASSAAHKRQLGEAIYNGKHAHPSLLSEVHAGALLANWGATIRFVPRSVTPTPDIEAVWDEGVIVDVEVVRGDPRQLHKAVRKGIDAFVGALGARDVNWHISAHLADAANSRDLESTLEAAIALRPNQSSGQEGKWHVCALSPEFRELVIGTQVTDQFGPVWWPKNESSFCAVSTLVGAIESPVVQIRSLVPTASYIGPVRRKAESRQGRTGHPYLIALDVSDLPQAHKRILAELSDYFEIWSNVSAVLLFESRFYFGYEHKEWLYSMHRNPYAIVPLPEPLATFSQERHAVHFRLTR